MLQAAAARAALCQRQLCVQRQARGLPVQGAVHPCMPRYTCCSCSAARACCSCCCQHLVGKGATLLAAAAMCHDILFLFQHLVVCPLSFTESIRPASRRTLSLALTATRAWPSWGPTEQVGGWGGVGAARGAPTHARPAGPPAAGRPIIIPHVQSLPAARPFETAACARATAGPRRGHSITRTHSWAKPCRPHPKP